MMTFKEILSTLKQTFSDISFEEQQAEGLMPFVVLPKEHLVAVCSYLQQTEGLYFDMLSCITAMDLGAEAEQMEVIYTLYSIPYNHSFCLKIRFDRNTSSEILPSVPSLTSLWKTADWHEREAFDLFGIQFEGHPDLRRILLPEDWEGYPLRKDYKEQEKYHGITVQYEQD